MSSTEPASRRQGGNSVPHALVAVAGYKWLALSSSPSGPTAIAATAVAGVSPSADIGESVTARARSYAWVGVSSVRTGLYVHALALLDCYYLRRCFREWGRLAKTRTDERLVGVARLWRRCTALFDIRQLLLFCLLLFLQTFPCCFARRPLCVRNEHKEGSWVRHNNVSTLTKSFHCCGYEGNDFEHDKEVCNNPLWEHRFTMRETNLVTGFSGFPMSSGEHACHCDKDQGRYSVNPREHYYWQPLHCDLLLWNATRFCDLLGTRRVLFVGDSTMAQSFTTLTNMLHAGNASCSKQILFGRCNMLVFGMKGGRNLFEWMQLSHLPDIVVINIAAHLHDLGDMMDILRRLGPILGSMRRMYTEARRPFSLVWRTSHSGHLDCSHATEPLSLPANLTDASRDKHGWRFHQAFDAMAANASRHLNYTVLDMSPLILRPDAHSGSHFLGDCLHYCIPGPIDIFSLILQQALLITSSDLTDPQKIEVAMQEATLRIITVSNSNCRSHPSEETTKYDR